MFSWEMIHKIINNTLPRNFMFSLPTLIIQIHQLLQAGFFLCNSVSVSFGAEGAYGENWRSSPRHWVSIFPEAFRV